MADSGINAKVTPDVTAGVRLSSGSLTDPSSPSQNLGTTSARYTVGIDQAYIRWDPGTATGFKYLTAVGGRIANPWFTPTELIYARDLTLEGAAFTGRISPNRVRCFNGAGGGRKQLVKFEC